MAKPALRPGFDPAGLDHLIRLFEPLADATGVLLAVSGGPDSVALMHLAARWAERGARPKISVATVDHGLRPAARREADEVVDHARGLGFDAVRLDWIGEKPRRGLPARARAARYALLLEQARACGASHIVTAHTLDDQAETVLMRFARGSGTLGLSGMRDTLDLGGVVLTRPFLGVPKSDLLTACHTHDWHYAVDPTNLDFAYARARWRQLAPVLAREGLTSGSIALLARRMLRADDALRQWTAIISREAALPSEELRRRFSMSRMATCPDEITLRILGDALVDLTGRDQPRLKGLEALACQLIEAHAQGRSLRRSFHHTVITLKDGVLELAPEPARRRGSKQLVQHGIGANAGNDADLTGSLGNPTPPTYIGTVVAPARLSDRVETLSASGSSRKPMLSTGPQ